MGNIWNFVIAPPLTRPVGDAADPTPEDVVFKHVTITADPRHPLMDKVHELVYHYSVRRGKDPRFLLLSYRGYKKLIAEISTVYQLPIIPDLIQQPCNLTPIIVSNPVVAMSVAGNPVDDFNYLAQLELYPRTGAKEGG